MPSIFGAISAGLGAPVITAFHGEDVVRWPSGIEADAETVEDAIWQMALEKDEGSINPQSTFSGTLAVLADTVLAAGDLWVINGETYRVMRTCEADPVTGRRELELIRVERSVTRNIGGAVTLVRGMR